MVQSVDSWCGVHGILSRVMFSGRPGCICSVEVMIYLKIYVMYVIHGIQKDRTLVTSKIMVWRSCLVVFYSV